MNDLDTKDRQKWTAVSLSGVCMERAGTLSPADAKTGSHERFDGRPPTDLMVINIDLPLTFTSQKSLFHLVDILISWYRSIQNHHGGPSSNWGCTQATSLVDHLAVPPWEKRYNPLQPGQLIPLLQADLRPLQLVDIHKNQSFLCNTTVNFTGSISNR